MVPYSSSCIKALQTQIMIVSQVWNYSVFQFIFGTTASENHWVTSCSYSHMKAKKISLRKFPELMQCCNGKPPLPFKSTSDDSFAFYYHQYHQNTPEKCLKILYVIQRSKGIIHHCSLTLSNLTWFEACFFLTLLSIRFHFMMTKN